MQKTKLPTFENIVANVLYARLTKKGVLNSPLPTKDGKGFYHWHKDDSHTTDKCHTFRRFMRIQRKKKWYDLSIAGEAALGLQGEEVKNQREDIRMVGGRSELRRDVKNDNKSLANDLSPRGLTILSPDKKGVLISTKRPTS